MPYEIKRPAFIGYAILVVLIVLAFIRVGSIQSELDREVELRQETVCTNHNQLRDVMAQIIEEAVLDEDPDAEDERFLEQVNYLLDQAECRPVLPP